MARVDFSNAQIEFLSSTCFNTNFQYWGLTQNVVLYNAEGNGITSNQGQSATASEKGFTVTKTGIFSATGTEFYFKYSGTLIARVYNIAFTEGDTYSFDVKVDVP